MLSPSLTTALVPYIGYNKAAEIARFMKDNCCSILDANKQFDYLPPEKLKVIISPERILKAGFTLDDITDNIS